MAKILTNIYHQNRFLVIMIKKENQIYFKTFSNHNLLSDSLVWVKTKENKYLLERVSSKELKNSCN